MPNNLRSLLAYLTAHPEKAFLADGVGALLSALLLGIVLPVFQAAIGMPPHLLYELAAAALLFSVYSLACFYFKPRRWRPYLAAIAIANSFYCVATASLVVYLYPLLTGLGVAYFAGELMIIGCLVFVETKVVLKGR